MPLSNVDAARLYKSRGWSPVPLEPGQKRPQFPNWQNFTVEDEQIEAAFALKQTGVILGPASNGLYDADLDEVNVVRIAKHFLPKTPAVFGRASKPQSHHIYQGVPGDEVNRVTFKDPDGTMLAEIRGKGSQTMFPPSVHPEGEIVTWENEENTMPATVPLEQTVRAVGWAAAAAMVIRHWDEWAGKHHDLIGGLAGGLLRARVPVDTVEAFIRVIMNYSGDHEPWDRINMVRSTAERLTNDPDAPVTGFPTLREIIGSDFVKRIITWLKLPKIDEDSVTLSDDGNADRFVDAFIDVMFFCPEMGQWYVWNEKHWREDNTGTAIAYAREIPDLILRTSRDISDEDIAEKIAKWSIASRSYARITAMPKLAQTDPRMQISNEALNVDPFLFNVSNGTINLRTGGLGPYEKSDYITHISPVRFDPRADCPQFKKYLQIVFAGDEELIEFIQRCVGYSLTASVIEQVFFLLYGPHGTGKTTLIETIRKLFGDYARNADPQTFMQKNTTSRANPDIARLQYARLVTTSETEDQNRLASALVKRMTGTTRMTASFLYQNEFEFDPIMKLWIDTNNKPRIPSQDGAVWARLVALPFEVQIRHTKIEIKGLKEHLAATELPGILNWAVEGCLNWQRDGLARPEQVAAANDAYRAENDALLTFIEEACIVSDDVRCGVKELYDAYQQWARSSNENVWRMRTFGAAMEERGFEKQRQNDGYTWLGIRPNTGLSRATLDGVQSNPFNRQNLTVVS